MLTAASEVYVKSKMLCFASYIYVVSAYLSVIEYLFEGGEGDQISRDVRERVL